VPFSSCLIHSVLLPAVLFPSQFFSIPQFGLTTTRPASGIAIPIGLAAIFQGLSPGSELCLDWVYPVCLTI